MMSRQEIQYAASDAWLLLAIVLAAGREGTSLERVIGAGDAINHAIFTADEMEGGLYRLIGGGYIAEVENGFKPTAKASKKYKAVTGKKKAWLDQMELLRQAIGAAPWSSDVMTKPPRAGLKDSGFSRQRFAESVKNYQEKTSKILNES